PTQVFAGSTFQVHFTVTNLGAGETDANGWSDAIWLAKTQAHPDPRKPRFDVLLTTVTHTGSLKVGESYDQVATITLPDSAHHIVDGVDQVEPLHGDYYIMPYADAYDAVLEDTLDVNINPDDPNSLDSNNFKARPITVLSSLAPP